MSGALTINVGRYCDQELITRIIDNVILILSLDEVDYPPGTK